MINLKKNTNTIKMKKLEEKIECMYVHAYMCVRHPDIQTD